MARVRSTGAFFLYAYVVMPHHLHLLLTPHNQNLTRLMRDIKSQSGFQIVKKRGTRGSFWQERYFDHIIRRVRHFWQKVE